MRFALPFLLACCLFSQAQAQSAPESTLQPHIESAPEQHYLKLPPNQMRADMQAAAPKPQVYSATGTAIEPTPTPEEQKRVEADGILTMVLENDLFSGTDKRYTNGIRFSYLTPPVSSATMHDPALTWIPTVSGADSVRFEYAFGQSMFTSDNKLDPNPPTTGRPYAGFLYGSAAVITEHADSQKSLQMTVGVVGPASGAHETQDFIHSIIDSPKAQGWGTQLKNEPALNFAYLQRERDWWKKDLGWLDTDLVPHFGGALGNVYTYANAGATLRVGANLPRDFGPPRIEPGFPGSGYFLPADEFGWYLFLSADGRAVARNIFLDGNTFSSSRSVDKDIFVGDLHIGAVATYSGYRLAYSYIIRSEEYDTQNNGDTYGILTLSIAL